MDIESFLTAHNISFQRYDHPAVFTVEESEKLSLDIPGAHTKNLFLRDEKGKRFFLVAVRHDKRVDLKQLRALLGVSNLSFGSPELLREKLGVEPGSVTLLGVVHDMEKQVEVIIDAGLWAADSLGCHPLVNTATLVISTEDMKKFFAATGHGIKVIDVPARG